ncbi:MAG: acetyl-CoA hydrolase/transferase C-terminal domain-containing protein [Firmicutes bacterium]|nr:acetyl-CoA hydrolase/transferase C-terminal domain-containing protein [Bacillota bacterium]
MTYEFEYRQKLKTAEEAVKLVKSGDWVDYSTHTGFPVLLDAALAKRRDELTDVKLRGLLISNRMETVESDPEREHFVYNSWHMSGYERKLSDRGLCTYIPMLFRNIASYYRNYLKVNVAMMCVTPMDKNGYFTFSYNVGYARSVMDAADIIILEVNERLPRVPGLQNMIHISEVDAVVEGEHPEVPQADMSPATETDLKVAELIVSNMRDGSVIQLGVGSMPDTIGAVIAQSDLKDLGVHSELLVNSNLEMWKAGKLTNKSKSGLFYGKSLFGIAYGNDELYDWIEDNPSMLATHMDYINDPYVVAGIENFVSINNCINVDLYGQISSESVGSRQISGTGGQLDFLEGGYLGKTANSFIAFTSTYTDKKGEMHSRIVPSLNGSIVTDPRSAVYNLVTEYGIECFAGCSLWERTQKLVNLAHPDFRDELIAEAEKLGIWRNSNKR